jgi:hypothetical protein
VRVGLTRSDVGGYAHHIGWDKRSAEEITVEKQQQAIAKVVSLYVCPSPECGNYYGASSMGDLSAAENRRSSLQNLAEEDPSNWGAVKSHRDECPDCRARDVTTHRELVAVTVPVTMLEAIVTDCG